mgnify:CR=1 FL=1
MYQVPLVGYLPLNIVPVIIIVVVIMVLHELYLRNRAKREEEMKSGRKV